MARNGDEINCTEFVELIGVSLYCAEHKVF